MDVHHHHQEIMESQSLESMLVCRNIKQQSENERQIGQKQQEKKPRPAEEAMKCPRCDSINTKFCYYNNYSLSQPRYFCKSCKRYWTQGGTLRNVPVGGGCRKNRRISSSSSSSSSTSSSSRRLPTPDPHHHHIITATHSSDPSSFINNNNNANIPLLGGNCNSHFALLGNASFLDPLWFGGGLENYAAENGRGISVNIMEGMHQLDNHNHNQQSHDDNQMMNMMSNSCSSGASTPRIIKHEIWGLPWQMSTSAADHHDHHHQGNYMMNINAAATTGVVGSSWHNLLNSTLI